MTNKYEIIIFWSDEDEAYVAEIGQVGCGHQTPRDTQPQKNPRSSWLVYLDALHRNKLQYTAICCILR